MRPEAWSSAPGAARRQGWASGRHWYTKPLLALGGLLTGAGKGFLQGAAGGWELGGKAGAAVGKFISPLFAPLVAPAAMVLAAAAELMPFVGAGVGALARWRMRVGTRDTMTEKGQLPTHSQIAKDDPEHPLHNAAARLAYVADRAITGAMICVWNGELPVAEAQSLVNDYVAHPASSRWWINDLLAVVRRK